MKCYVIKTNNNKYLKCDWEPSFMDDENDEGKIVLSETLNTDISLFTKNGLYDFIEEYNEGHINHSPIYYESKPFDISDVEEVTTTPCNTRKSEFMT